MLRQSIVVAAAALALTLGGHRLLPELGGFTPVLESLLPGSARRADPADLRAGTRSWQVILAALVPATVWGSCSAALLRSPPGGPSDLSVATLNVGATNAASAEAMRSVSKGRDLVAVQELTTGGPAAKSSTTTSPTATGSPRSGCGAGCRSATPSGWTSAWTGRGRCGRWSSRRRATSSVYVVHLGSARAGHTATRDETLTARPPRCRQDDAGIPAGGARRPEHRHHRPGVRPGHPAVGRRAGRRRAGLRLHLAGGASRSPAPTTSSTAA